MIQPGGFLSDLVAGLAEAVSRTGVHAKKKGTPISYKNASKYFVNQKVNKLNNRFTVTTALGMTLTNNEINVIIKVTKSLERRDNLLLLELL